MNTIQQNNDPTNAPYNLSCLRSYAITDSTVPRDDKDHKSIWLCPLFFTGKDTKNDLPDTKDEDKLKEWCDQKDYTLFPTAGM